MRNGSKYVGSILIFFCLAIMIGFYYLFTDVKSTVKEAINSADLKKEFINVDSIPDIDKKIKLDSIPVDSFKVATENGKPVELEDGSVIALKDSKLVAIKDGNVKKINDSITLKDGSKAIFNYGKLLSLDKKSKHKLEFKDSVIASVNEKKRRVMRDSLVSAFKDSLVRTALDSVENHNKKFDKKLKGNKVTILITGVDSRFGSSEKHADANHVVNVWFDTGIIEIITIPRGTRADAGYPDTSKENYLANVRSNRGKKEYIAEVCRISGVKKIDYTVEFGFSQALGLLELMGYKENSVQMLRMLRTRKSFNTGDHQRAYNQGQFIRQMILKLFTKLDGVTGDVILRGGLMLVETDLTLSTVKSIRQKLKEKGFPHSDNDVILRVRPNYSHGFKDYNFTDDASVGELYDRTSNLAVKMKLNEKKNDRDGITNKITEKIESQLKKARPDTINNPKKVIKTLQVLFDQRIWFQIGESQKRNQYREEICQMLSSAYIRNKDMKKAQHVLKILQQEKEVFNGEKPPKKEEKKKEPEKEPK